MSTQQPVLNFPKPQGKVRTVRLPLWQRVRQVMHALLIREEKGHHASTVRQIAAEIDPRLPSTIFHASVNALEAVRLIICTTPNKRAYRGYAPHANRERFKQVLQALDAAADTGADIPVLPDDVVRLLEPTGAFQSSVVEYPDVELTEQASSTVPPKSKTKRRGWFARLFGITQVETEHPDAVLSRIERKMDRLLAMWEDDNDDGGA